MVEAVASERTPFENFPLPVLASCKSMPTLLQYYHDFLRGRNRAHQGTEGLLRLYFSDSNVQAIEDAIHARLGQLIGDLRDAREATTVQNSIQLRDALFQVAFERGHQPANPEILLDMNRRAVERAVNALSAELVYQARFERFRKHGARPGPAVTATASIEPMSRPVPSSCNSISSKTHPYAHFLSLCASK